MSELIVNNNQPAESEAPSSGMTTKVVKGSFFTLVGQIMPMAASLIATPFIIRFLGSEAYGVVILVGLIPNYFAFADFGMGIASTKFGSEAYADGRGRDEGEIVRTAAAIALAMSLLFAVPIFVFAREIIAGFFNVPADYREAATVALRITSASFVLGIIASVVNTPMLARLRMDLNMLTTALPKVAMTLATPLVLYLGGRVVEAIWVAFGGAVLMLIAVIVASGRLQPEVFRPSVSGKWLRPLLGFGFGWLLAMIAGILLSNVEKFLLARYATVQSLAHYSIAFTFAGMATMFSQAMTQSLVPAFSQLQAPGRRDEFAGLYVRSIRLNLIWLMPALAGMFVTAKPFFTRWAGPEFGVASSPPFYILLFGLFFNILAYIPHSTITAAGRTSVFAKLYWIELVIYVLIAVWLVRDFGIVGAAAAWSARVVIDAVVVIILARRISGAALPLGRLAGEIAAGFAVLSPPVIYAAFVDNFSWWLVPVTAVSLLAYAFVVWNFFADASEKEWISGRVAGLLKSSHVKR